MLKLVEFGAAAADAEGAHGENLRARRGADQPRMRRDRAGDAGAVDMRLLVALKRVERADDAAGKLRMVCIDAGIDHRDDDAVAARHGMGFGELQLGHDILRRIAGARGLRLLDLENGNYDTRQRRGIGGELALHRIDRAAGRDDASGTSWCQGARKLCDSRRVRP